MPENELIAEVRRHREELARESGYNIRAMLRSLREDEQHFAAQGYPVVSFVHERPSGWTRTCADACDAARLIGAGLL